MGHFNNTDFTQKHNLGQFWFKILPSTKQALKDCKTLLKFRQSGDILSNLITLPQGFHSWSQTRLTRWCRLGIKYCWNDGRNMMRQKIPFSVTLQHKKISKAEVVEERHCLLFMQHPLVVNWKELAHCVDVLVVFITKKTRLNFAWSSQCLALHQYYQYLN